MKLSLICIKRPVFASVLALVLILFGLVGYFKLSVQDLPQVDFPIVMIHAVLVGANPEIVDTTITDPIESEINTIEGVKHIKSKSLEGLSSIIVKFDQHTAIDQAAQDVRDCIARIRNTLPNDIEEPLIQKLDLGAMPVMWLAVRSNQASPSELSYYADKVVRERLQKVEGVGSAVIAGEKKFALRLWLNPEKLFAYQLTSQDVERAIQQNNIELPSGRLEGHNREFSIKTDGEIKNAQEFENIIITYRGDHPICLRDIGSIEEGIKDTRSLARYSSETAIGIGVIKQSSANTIEVAKAIEKELLKITPLLPQDINIDIAFNSAEFIEQSINEVKETLWSAALLVVISIFIFLRNFRSTLIPALAIPLSIIATFSAMHFLGFSLNNFTLLALVLSIGVVVDDAIVMLENIFRHIEEGKTPYKAAIQGSKEMTLPIISASLALITVFIPLAFMEGLVGEFFFEFGVTVSIAVAVSAFVSLTLTPMLSSKLIRIRKGQSTLFIFLERLYVSLENGYKIALKWALKRKGMILLLAMAIVGGSGALVFLLGKEFVPNEDIGSFLIELQAPEGSTLNYTDHYLQEIERRLKKHPGVEGYFAALALDQANMPAVNKGMVFVNLHDVSKRASMSSIIGEFREDFRDITGIDTTVITMNPFSGGNHAKTFEYILTNPDYTELKTHAAAFVSALKQTPGFSEVDFDLEDSTAQLALRIDREKVADLGVSIQEIAHTLNLLLTGRELTKYKKKGERYSLIGQMEKSFCADPQSLNSLYIRSQKGNLVRLDTITTIEEEIGSNTINRYDRRKAVTISANLEGITLQEAIQKADSLVKEMLPSTFVPTLSGQAEEMMKTFTSLLFTFGMALVITYLVLAAQFESFLYPLIIMAALPLSLIGAFGGLYIFGMTLNMYSLIGMIMLMGLVTKNAILLVDSTNHLKCSRLSTYEALCEAGRIRLRPILMTAFSTILGIVPIAFGLGAGAESRRPLGICVIGGMLSSTALTLFIIPCFYLIMDRLKERAPQLLRLMKRKASAAALDEKSV